MDYVVDMQGFLKQGGDLVLKELAIAPLHAHTDPQVFLFREPFPWKKLTEKYREENKRLSRHYHKILWETDGLPYDEIGKVLASCLTNARIVYVRGSLRKSWLEKFHFHVIDMTEMGCPPEDRSVLVTVCTNHNEAFKASCALYNVNVMKDFYHEHIRMQCDDDI